MKKVFDEVYKDKETKMSFIEYCKADKTLNNYVEFVEFVNSLAIDGDDFWLKVINQCKNSKKRTLFKSLNDNSIKNKINTGESTSKICFPNFYNSIIEMDNQFIEFEIDNKLNKRIHEKINNYKCCFISGEGGLGKTCEALHYARVFEKEYANIQFIKYDSNLRDTLLKIEFCNENKDSNFKIVDSELIMLGNDENGNLATKVLSLLKTKMNKTLLIIDNFDEVFEGENNNDSEWFSKLRNTNIDILVTTRINNLYNDNLHVELPLLTCNQQVELFKKYYKDEDEVELTKDQEKI